MATEFGLKLNEPLNKGRAAVQGAIAFKFSETSFKNLMREERLRKEMQEVKDENSKLKEKVKSLEENNNRITEDHPSPVSSHSSHHTIKQEDNPGRVSFMLSIIRWFLLPINYWYGN